MKIHSMVLTFVKKGHKKKEQFDLDKVKIPTLARSKSFRHPVV